jgi:hypothetical protein
VSELTLCNYCKLQLINEEAKARGATVTVKAEQLLSTMEPWLAVRISDRHHVECWMMELTPECSC